MDFKISNKAELVSAILDELHRQLQVQMTPPLNPPLFTEDNVLLIESKLFYYLMQYIRDEQVEALIVLNESDKTCMQWAVRDVVGRIGTFYSLPKGAVVNYRTGENIVKSGLCEVLWEHAKRIEEPKPSLLSWIWKSTAITPPLECQLKIDGHALDKIRSTLVETTLVALSDRMRKAQCFVQDQKIAASNQRNSLKNG